jgi:hypothetical protein
MPAVQYNQNLNIINQWRERVGAESFDDQLFEAVEQTIIDSDMEDWADWVDGALFIKWIEELQVSQGL